MSLLAAIEWNRLLDPPIGAIIFGGIAGVFNFAIIGYFWYRSREIRLKERMVDRGFSAEEIERVVHAVPARQEHCTSPVAPRVQGAQTT
jgi:hypothetical protein